MRREAGTGADRRGRSWAFIAAIAAALLVAPLASADEPPQSKQADEPLQGKRRTESATKDLRPEAQVAVDPPPEPIATPSPPAPPADDGAGPRLTFGRAITQHIGEGFFGRFDTEQFKFEGRFIQGALLGIEGWGSPDGGGGGAIGLSGFIGGRFPLHAGPRAPSFFATLGLGADLMLLDVVYGDVGFGIFAPFAAAVVGMEVFPGARLLADARGQFRWQWGAMDRFQLRLGATIALNSMWWDG